MRYISRGPAPPHTPAVRFQEQDPEFDWTLWSQAVESRNTSLGYWDWGLLQCSTPVVECRRL